MINWELSRILPLILECGQTALKYFEYPQQSFKADHSILTEADTTIEARLQKEFDFPEKGSYILGEETIDTKSEDYLAQAFKNTAWIIDPIDGTAPFSNNLPTWGVSIGFMQQGILKEGAIFLAALGELYYTDRGGVYRQRLGSDPQRWVLGTGTPLKAPSPELRRGSMISISQQLARSGCYELPFYIQVTGSSVFALTKLAAGSYSAHVTRFRLWDFAAGLPMIHNLGFVSQFFSGENMTLEMNEKNIILQAGHPHRWTCRDQVIFGPSSEAVKIIRDGLGVQS